MEATPAREDVLDNVVWHALRGPQRGLAEWSPSGRSGRFDPRISVFAAVDRFAPGAWSDLGTLVGPGGVAVLFRDEVPPPPDGWREIFREPTWQLLAGPQPPEPDEEIVRLGLADADDMLALARLTEPGPYLAGTRELGTYVGIRCQGELLAMAGERFRAPGFTEISAVCTHPDARRRGYAAALTSWLVRQIRDRGEEAFLHVLATNAGGLCLYEKLGFHRRRQVDAVAAIFDGEA